MKGWKLDALSAVLGFVAGALVMTALGILRPPA